MSEVNFYLKKPDVYCCKEHPAFVSWSPGNCQYKEKGNLCNEKLIIRRDKNLPAGTIKKDPAGIAKRLIYLQFLYDNQKLVFSFGQSIDPRNWNPDKQRVKSNKETTSDKSHNLNDLLKSLEEVCKEAYNTEMKNGIPLPNVLRKYLEDFLNKNIDKPKNEKPTFFNLLDRFISNEIKISRGEKKKIGKKRAEATVHNYKALNRHLQDFQRLKNFKVDFETINRDFFNKYISFLEDHIWKISWQKEKGKKSLRKTIISKQPGEGLSVNSIAKDIRKLKSVLNEAVENGYTNNQEFKKGYFSFSEEETDAVYLSDKEIITLYRHDFSKNKTLEQIRDWFVFSSFIGLRYQDITSLEPDNIVSIDNDLFIKTITRKTKELVVVPCNPVVLEIIGKYEQNLNGLPRVYENQVYNRYLKQICQIAGLTEKGRLSTDTGKELWLCISSHTSRRSFATNLYLDGYPVDEIRKITGHKTEKAFWKYIKVSKLDSAKRLSSYQKANWPAKIARIENQLYKIPA
jgi:integrase